MTRPDASQGIFETLLVRDGRVQALEAHLDRLAVSLSELFSTPLPDGVRSAILSRARSLSGEHRLRVDAVPHAGGAGIAITTSALTVRASVALGTPVTISGGLGSHKWRDRGLLDGLAERAGPGRIVLVADGDGQVLEAAWANLWLLDGEHLRTPPSDGRLLPGVTRARLLSLAPALGLRAEEQPIAMSDIHDPASAVFLTSSLRVTPLAPSGATSAPIDPRIAAIAEALASGGWSEPASTATGSDGPLIER